MLQNHTIKGGDHKPLKSLGFLVGVGVEDWVNPEQLLLALIDSLQWVEGVDKPEVEFLGEIPKYEDEMQKETV